MSYTPFAAAFLVVAMALGFAGPAQAQDKEEHFRLAYFIDTLFEELCNKEGWRMKYKGRLAGLFIAAAVASVPAVQAETAPKSAVEVQAVAISPALQMGEFQSKSVDERADIVFHTLVSIKRDLRSPTFSDGSQKPEDVLALDREISTILDKHFEATSDSVPESFIALYNALDNADPDQKFMDVFYDHLDEVIDSYLGEPKMPPSPTARDRFDSLSASPVGSRRPSAFLSPQRAHPPSPFRLR